ncbi:MAG: EthD domain-containing protein [Rhodospirillaceae bacterium]
MIKLVMCLTRRSDLTREEFLDYWLNKHAPFFLENAHIMRSKRYVQDHTLTSPLNDVFRSSRNMMPEFDGIAEVWFESEQDLMEAFGTQEGQDLGAALLKDESNFVDHERSAAFLVQEHEL